MSIEVIFVTTIDVIVVIGFLCMIISLTGTFIVGSQIIVMQFKRKIFHFIPAVFYAIQFIYGILRANGIIIYYSDMNGGFDSPEWQEDGMICCFLSILGLIVSFVILITAYFKNKKSPVVTAKKSTKIIAGIFTAFLIAFSGVYSYEIISYPYGENHDFQNQKLLAIGEYMFEELDSGNFNLDKNIRHEDVESVKSDAYDAFRYTRFESVYFLDKHTVCIYEGGLFDSVKGYIVTDGEKEYSGKYYKINGYENLYSWSGETLPETISS